MMLIWYLHTPDKGRQEVILSQAGGIPASSEHRRDDGAESTQLRFHCKLTDRAPEDYGWREWFDSTSETPVVEYPVQRQPCPSLEGLFYCGAKSGRLSGNNPIIAAMMMALIRPINWHNDMTKLKGDGYDISRV